MSEFAVFILSEIMEYLCKLLLSFNL
jgi:hypothetical protein